MLAEHYGVNQRTIIDIMTFHTWSKHTRPIYLAKLTQAAADVYGLHMRDHIRAIFDIFLRSPEWNPKQMFAADEIIMSLIEKYQNLGFCTRVCMPTVLMIT